MEIDSRASDVSDVSDSSSTNGVYFTRPTRRLPIVNENYKDDCRQMENLLKKTADSILLKKQMLNQELTRACKTNKMIQRYFIRLKLMEKEVHYSKRTVPYNELNDVKKKIFSYYCINKLNEKPNGVLDSLCGFFSCCSGPDKTITKIKVKKTLNATNQMRKLVLYLRDYRYFEQNVFYNNAEYSSTVMELKRMLIENEKNINLNDYSTSILVTAIKDVIKNDLQGLVPKEAYAGIHSLRKMDNWKKHLEQLDYLSFCIPADKRLLLQDLFKMIKCFLDYEEENLTKTKDLLLILTPIVFADVNVEDRKELALFYQTLKVLYKMDMSRMNKQLFTLANK